MEMRNTRAVASETCATVFHNLALCNVVLNIKDSKGCEYICLFISLNSILQFLLMQATNGFVSLTAWKNVTYKQRLAD